MVVLVGNPGLGNNYVNALSQMLKHPWKFKTKYAEIAFKSFDFKSCINYKVLNSIMELKR